MIPERGCCVQTSLLKPVMGWQSDTTTRPFCISELYRLGFHLSFTRLFARDYNTLALPFLLSNDLLNSVKQEIYVNVARLALRGRTFTTLTNVVSFLTTYNPFVDIFYLKC